jgi:hypothetical protein
MPLDAHFARRGFLPKQKINLFAKIWHPWLPRNVVAMIWIILINDLPIEVWIRRIGHHGNCIFYKTRIIKTSKHMFFTCSWVIDAWKKFNIIQSAISLTPKPFIWEQIIWGILEPPKILQDSNNPSLFNIETPWELL